MDTLAKEDGADYRLPSTYPTVCLGGIHSFSNHLIGVIWDREFVYPPSVV